MVDLVSNVITDRTPKAQEPAGSYYKVQSDTFTLLYASRKLQFQNMQSIFDTVVSRVAQYLL